MTKFKPGSFTKNIGWSTDGDKGFRKLYNAIRRGFDDKIASVKREAFRKQCGINDGSKELVPLNIFLHNTIVKNENYVTVDELVRSALRGEHTQVFDYLSLFSVHLDRGGKRIGNNGSEHPTTFINYFVRKYLWQDGGWLSKNTIDQFVDSAFRELIDAENRTIVKCKTNYLYLLEISGLLGQKTSYLNLHQNGWLGPAVYLALDRHVVDAKIIELSASQLIDALKQMDFHMLVGAPDDIYEVIELLVDEYIESGGIHRDLSQIETLTTENGGVEGQDGKSERRQIDTKGRTRKEQTKKEPDWSNEDAESLVAIMRRLQQVRSQVRNSRIIKELKHLYSNACMICGKKLIFDVNPLRYYSEGAHIKPVGKPHNGPDTKKNIIILCPEHHLQFDNGVLTLKKIKTKFIINSKVQGDPLHGTELKIKPPHELLEEYVDWHRLYWSIDNE